MEEAGIKIDCVAGTSIGALIGSVYASGKLEDLEKVYLNFDWKKIAYFFDIVFPKSGLIDGNKVADFVREYVQAEMIEHLPLPFQTVATDIGSGEEITMDKGDVIEGLRKGKIGKKPVEAKYTFLWLGENSPFPQRREVMQAHFKSATCIKP